jgi:hypothetical protein
MDEQENKTPETTTPTRKKVVAKKQRYFVPSLGRQVEATNLAEVEKIVNKETAKGKGELTKRQGK